MDPKFCLTELRALCLHWKVETTDNRLDIGDEIVHYIEALDEWLQKGGASPWDRQEMP